MKADLHVHTCYSNDGVSTPEQVIEACVAGGIDIVAVTDHNEFKAYFDIKDNDRGIIVVPAEEVSSKEGHIVALGIDRHIERDMSIQETIDAIHEAGGYAIAAHPYRWWSGLGPKNTINHEFDGTEAMNARSIPSANRKSYRLARKLGRPMSAGSDAHSPERIGWGYLELPDGLKTWQDVVQAVMEGKGVPHSKSRGFLRTLRYGIKSIGQWMFRGFRRM
ncbi:MAG: PHP domain-containing protein [archaeon]|nr:PHP domain-containing protein [archaeon]